MTTAVAAGFPGYAVGQQWIPYGCAMLGVVVLVTISFIRERDIDYDSARALPDRRERVQVWSLADIFRNTHIGLFAVIITVFHFSNAAMLPLAGRNWRRKNKGRLHFTCRHASFSRRRLWSRCHGAWGGSPTRWGENPSFWQHSSCWAYAEFYSRSATAVLYRRNRSAGWGGHGNRAERGRSA